MITTLHGLSLLLYVTAAGALGASLAGGRPGAPRWAGAVIGAGALAHGSALASYAVVHGELPLIGLAPALSTLAFLIGTGLVLFAVFREVRPLGLVLLPLIVLLLGAALAQGIAPAGGAPIGAAAAEGSAALPGSAGAEPAFRGVWFALHVVLAFTGYAGLAIAFAAGLLYLIQFRTLKDKRFGRWFRFLPPLATLDRAGRQALLVGFPALTLALGLGWAWTVRHHRSLAADNPQVIWGIVSWFIFVFALTARAGGSGRDRRGALASVVGFVVVVLVYVVLRLAMAERGAFL